ncbi:hypothetical protein ACIBCB_26210 [Streptomyces uncialis]|uniref:DUF7144 family membrane protein n=1 Tax=Streptomyces uncialis TaxID=1048205 RepID=UPI0037BB66FD
MSDETPRPGDGTSRPGGAGPRPGGEGLRPGGEGPRPGGAGPNPPPTGGAGAPQGAGGTPWDHGRAPAPDDPRREWVLGGVLFAGVLLLCNGVLAILQGISAIAQDDVYESVGSYVYDINLTGWGWLLLGLGVLAAVTGWGLLSNADWARIAGIVLASLSLVAQFLFLPYQPVWAVIMIAIDVFVIWALVAYRPVRGGGSHV